MQSVLFVERMASCVMPMMRRTAFLRPLRGTSVSFLRPCGGKRPEVERVAERSSMPISQRMRKKVLWVVF